MFSIEKKSESGFEKIILKNDETGNFAAVIPACGAILHEFVVQTNEPVNVIDSFQSFEEFKNSLKEKGFLGCKLSPFVCRIPEGKYTFGNEDYLIEKSLPAKNALHGLLYDRSFKVISESAGEANASVTMKYEYRAEDPGYPFNYDCIVTWQLEDGNKLSVITECINKDEGLIPIQDGWHPYFTLGERIDDLHLEFQAMELVELNADLVPTGNLSEYTRFTSLEKLGDTVLDNCFTLNRDACQPMCVLRNVVDKIEVQLIPDASYPYLQIYTPPHRKSIAIENLSGAPNAFNNGMGFIVLEPDQSAIFKTAYKIRLLK